jgi:hypothetical protein
LHYEQLRCGSGLSDATIAEAKFETVTDPQRLRSLGFSRWQSQQVPALLCPFFDPSGQTFYQIKPDRTPTMPDGSRPKYLTAKHTGYGLGASPGQQALLRDPSVPLYVTEGSKKLWALVQAGRCTVGLCGVWMGCVGQESDPQRPLLPGWNAIALRGRIVRICFDSDAMSKGEVHAACRDLARKVEARGATVEYVLLPDQPSGDKQGADDFLKDHTIHELEALVSPALPPLPSPAAGAPSEETLQLERHADRLRRMRGLWPQFSSRPKQKGQTLGVEDDPLFQHLEALGANGLEIARFLCQPRTKQVTQGEFCAVKNALFACHESMKTAAPYLFGCLYLAGKERVKWGAQGQMAEDEFGKNMTRTVYRWSRVAQHFPPERWQACVPLNFYVGLIECAPEADWPALIQEWHDRRYERPFKAAELRSRYEQPKPQTPFTYCREELTTSTFAMMARSIQARGRAATMQVLREALSDDGKRSQGASGVPGLDLPEDIAEMLTGILVVCGPDGFRDWVASKYTSLIVADDETDVDGRRQQVTPAGINPEKEGLEDAGEVPAETVVEDPNFATMAKFEKETQKKTPKNASGDTPQSALSEPSGTADPTVPEAPAAPEEAKTAADAAPVQPQSTQERAEALLKQYAGLFAKPDDMNRQTLAQVQQDLSRIAAGKRASPEFLSDIMSLLEEVSAGRADPSPAPAPPEEPADRQEQPHGQQAADSLAELRLQVRQAWLSAGLQASPQLLSAILQCPVESVPQAFQQADMHALQRLRAYAKTGRIEPADCAGDASPPFGRRSW